MAEIRAGVAEAGMADGRREAQLFRMDMGQHVCPWGLKARDLLRREGYRIEDHPLTSRAEVDAFKAREGVSTTPQAFVGGRRIGGYDDLRRFLGRPVPDRKAPTYRPVAAVFGVSLLLALAASTAAFGTPFAPRAAMWFVAFATGVLAILKLGDVEGFSTGFLGYDLLARRWVPYAYAYPWLEALVAVLMASGRLPWLAAPVALAIGGIGAASVVKAVYVDRRELRCACVGGGSNVPLGFVSLLENLLMVGMGLWAIGAAL